jgi:hypothetical protein
MKTMKGKRGRKWGESRIEEPREEEENGKKVEEIGCYWSIHKQRIQISTTLFPLPLHIITLHIAHHIITVILLLREEPYRSRYIAPLKH